MIVVNNIYKKLPKFYTMWKQRTQGKSDDTYSINKLLDYVNLPKMWTFSWY